MPFLLVGSFQPHRDVGCLLAVVVALCLRDFLERFHPIESSATNRSRSQKGVGGIEDCPPAFLAVRRFSHTAFFTGFCTFTPLASSPQTTPTNGERIRSVSVSVCVRVSYPASFHARVFSFAVPSGVRFSSLSPCVVGGGGTERPHCCFLQCVVVPVLTAWSSDQDGGVLLPVKEGDYPAEPSSHTLLPCVPLESVSSSPLGKHPV